MEYFHLDKYRSQTQAFVFCFLYIFRHRAYFGTRLQKDYFAKGKYRVSKKLPKFLQASFWNSHELVDIGIYQSTFHFCSYGNPQFHIVVRKLCDLTKLQSIGIWPARASGAHDTHRETTMRERHVLRLFLLSCTLARKIIYRTETIVLDGAVCYLCQKIQSIEGTLVGQFAFVQNSSSIWCFSFDYRYQYLEL